MEDETVLKSRLSNVCVQKALDLRVLFVAAAGLVAVRPASPARTEFCNKLMLSIYKSELR